MEGETFITLSNSSPSQKSVHSISILVVDDDVTCLTIVAAILKKFKYEVVTVKHPSDALCKLRIKKTSFDLVVSDVHMPDMDGFELQQVITQEFNLPVVLMSADDKEGVALKGLENGAAFFILKPVCADDVRDLWQFAAMKKKRSNVVIEEIPGSFSQDKVASSTEKNNSDEIDISASSSSANEITVNRKSLKRKLPRNEGSNDKNRENSESASQKKAKVIWTNSLHNRFLEAIRSIGLDRAVPKKILEVMNVPGLTRENVASHLQKYRIFLRRVSDASYKIQYSADKGLSKKLRSSLEPSSTTSPSTLNLNRFNKLNYQSPRQPFPNLETSSITQPGFGQSRLLSSKESLLRPNTGYSNLFNQSSRPSVRPTQYSHLAGSSMLQGPANLPSITLEDLSGALSTSFATSSIGPTRLINPNTSYEASPQNNTGISTTSSLILLTPSQIYTNQTNYVGYSISNLKHLTGSGNKEKHEGLDSCRGVINHELQNNGTNVQAAITTLPNDNVNLDLLAHNVGNISSSFVGHSNGGELLSDVVNPNYRMLLSSNTPNFVCGVENGGETHEQPYTPLDLSEFYILSTPQPLDQGNFDTNLVNQLNIQNQAQQNGGEPITSSNFYGSMTTQWLDNLAPSIDQTSNQQQCSQGLVNSHEFGNYSQLNKTVLIPPYERDDDDFLESLLAPFGEDQILEGI